MDPLRIDKSSWFALLALALVGTAGCLSTRTMKIEATTGRDTVRHGPPPNIVMIFTDDQRFDSLGCTGHPFIETPHLDRVARQGALFEKAFVITSLCCPSRATVLSGLYTHLSGVSANGMDLDYDAVPILPHFLKQAGYATAFLGKIHLGNNGRPRPGFDHWAGLVDNQGRGAYFDARMNINGVVEQTTGFSTDVLAGAAVDWIQAHRDRPFFLFLSLKSPHVPLKPPPRHAGLYADEIIELPDSYTDPPDRLPRLVRTKPYARPIRAQVRTDDGARRFLRSYARMIPSIDEAVGRIDGVLEELQIQDRTVLIFFSDNGFLHGEHRLFQKGLAYEESVHVPLLIRYPGVVPPGSRFGQQVLNLDLAPTILDLAGVAVPAFMRGRSLLPLLTGTAPEWRSDWLFLNDYREEAGPPFLAVRSDQWKYIRYREEVTEEELFDLVNDPGERANLALDPVHRRHLKAMRARMRKLMAEEKVPGSWWKRYPKPTGQGAAR